MRITVLLCFLLYFPSELFSAHISGGEFNVRALGGNQYQITYRSYTICGRNAVASGIRMHNLDNNQLTTLGGFVLQSSVQLPNTSPCPANPAGACTIQHTYLATVTIPANNNGYVIYQSSSARSAGILNIANSGGAGYAYYVQIPGTNTTGQNSTPVFNNLPPASICTGVPVQLNLSATDADNDSLVYTYTDPLAQITSTGFGINFNPITYAGGASSANLTGSNLQLNPSTGVVSGVQNTTGIYSIAVRVQEYRNGQLIGTSMRDFIYNFQNCPTTSIPITNSTLGINLGINGNTAACDGTVNLDANQGGQNLQNFVWNDGTSGPILGVDAPNSGLYTVGAINAQGCLFTGQATVNFTPLTCTVSGSGQMCSNNLTPLVATCDDPNATFTWNGQPGGWQYIPSQSGTVICVASSASGTCTAVDSFEVRIDEPVSINLGRDTTLCNNEQLWVTLDTLSSSFQWEDGTSTNPRNVSAPGQYILKVSEGVCSTSDTLRVNRSSLTVGISGDSLQCSDAVSILDANPSDVNATCIWNQTAVGTTFLPSSTGWYQVIGSNGFCVARDSFFVEVKDPPAIVLGPDTSLCLGDALVFNLDSLTDPFTWEDGGNQTQRMIDSAGVYHVSLTRGACFSSDTIRVSTIEVGAEILGDTALLRANLSGPPGVVHSWQGIISGDLDFPTWRNEGVVLSASFAHCSASDSTTIVLNPLPNYSLGPDTLLCNGAHLTLSVPMGNYRVLWENGSSDFTRTIQDSGLYVVTLTSPDSCSLQDSIQVSVNQALNLLPADSVFLCRDSIFRVDLQGLAQSFFWPELGSNASQVDLFQTNLYHLQFMDYWGCPQWDSIRIAVDTLSFELGADTVLCAPFALTIDLTQEGSNFTWSNGTTGPLFSPPQSGRYEVSGQNLNGCDVRDEIRIDFDTLKIGLPGDTSICSGETLLIAPTILDGIGGIPTITWSTGHVGGDESIHQAGTYWVSADDLFCSASDSMRLELFDLPTVELGLDTLICSYDSLVLDLYCNGCTYLWNDGSTSSKRAIDSEGTYWALVQDLNQCLNSDSLVLDLEAPPALNLPDTISFCADSTFLLGPQMLQGHLYRWSTGQTQTPIQPAHSGTYFLTAFSPNNCKSVDTAEVFVVPNPEVNLGGDQLSCDAEVLQIGQMVSPEMNVFWSTGARTPFLEVNEKGYYRLTVSNELGCSHWDEVMIDTLSSPRAVTDTFLVPCDFKLLELEAFGPGDLQYHWNTAEEEAWISVNDTGLFWVEKKNVCGRAVDSLWVKYDEPCDCRVFVPNAFSPDGDGLNDEFQIVATCEISNYRLDILDRWGQRVFSSTDPQEHWSPVDAPIDVYVYLLRFSTWEQNLWLDQEYSGTLTLIK